MAEPKVDLATSNQDYVASAYLLFFLVPLVWIVANARSLARSRTQIARLRGPSKVDENGAAG